MVKKNRGFTLVELVISVVVLALVFVMAVPSMVKQQNLEERVAVDQAAGYFGSAIALARAAWVVAGRPGEASNLPGFRQGTFNFNTSGWPIGTVVNSKDDMTSSACASLWVDIQDFERSVTTQSSGSKAEFIASSQQGSCLFQFSGDKDRSIHYNTKTGKIRVNNV